MTVETTQSGNTVHDGDLVGGNKIVNYLGKKTKLSLLFIKLKSEFDTDNKIFEITENLRRYSDGRDSIGLEQKLVDGERDHLIEDAIWLKQEYAKKLTRFQFFEPAQEIHAFLLGIVLEKFKNKVNPMIRSGSSETEIMRVISVEIIEPVLNLIQEEGCEDIMGLSSTEIGGMIYYLTGQCHIKWAK